MERDYFPKRKRVSPREIARAAMPWLRGTTEQPVKPKGSRSEDGYTVRNGDDWPERICGTLSLRDVFEVAKGVQELGIPPNTTVENYRDTE